MGRALASPYQQDQTMVELRFSQRGKVVSSPSSSILTSHRPHPQVPITPLPQMRIRSAARLDFFEGNISGCLDVGG